MRRFPGFASAATTVAASVPNVYYSHTSLMGEIFTESDLNVPLNLRFELLVGCVFSFFRCHFEEHNKTCSENVRTIFITQTLS